MRRGDYTLNIGENDEDDLATKLAEKYGVDSPTPSPEKSSDNVVDYDYEKILHQRDHLIRKLDEKNKKIESLCVMLEAMSKSDSKNDAKMEKYNKMLDGQDNSEIDFRDSKIVALAKKSHNLQMCLNKERATTEGLTQKLDDLKSKYESQTQQMQTMQVNLKATPPKKPVNRFLPSTMTVDAEQLNSQEEAQKRQSKEIKDLAKLVDETKKKLSVLTDENKNLSRALTRELGDGVELEQAVSGGWRGRAQQIIMLKSKIKKLEAAASSGITLGSMSKGRGTNNDVDAKAEEELHEMSNERRKMVESLTEERLQLMESNKALETKSSSQRARISTLEGEVRRMKDNLQLVLEKAGNDDDLLDALRNEVGRLKGQLSKAKAQAEELGITAMTKGTRRATDTMSVEQHDLDMKMNQTELQRLQRLCKNQAEQIESQDNTIRQLKKRTGLQV